MVAIGRIKGFVKRRLWTFIFLVVSPCLYGADAVALHGEGETRATIASKAPVALFAPGIYVYMDAVAMLAETPKTIYSYQYTAFVVGDEALLKDVLAMVQIGDKDIFKKLLARFRDTNPPRDPQWQFVIAMASPWTILATNGNGSAELAKLFSEPPKGEEPFPSMQVYKFDYQTPGQVFIDSVDAAIPERLRKQTGGFDFRSGQYEVLSVNSQRLPNLKPEDEDSLPYVIVKRDHLLYWFEKRQGPAALFRQSHDGSSFERSANSVQKILMVTPLVEFVQRQLVKIDDGDIIVTSPPEK